MTDSGTLATVVEAACFASEGGFVVKVKERTDRDEEDLVRIYLTDIGQYPLLTKDDEVRLAQEIEVGLEARRVLKSATPGSLTDHRRRELRRQDRRGQESEQTFVKSNLRLVVSIAKKYQASGLPLLDLIQEGNLGLMHAVEKFDWRKGFKFSTYATWWIRQAITRGIANTGRTIRLPVHAGDTLARLQKARSRLELKHGRPPTLGELAAEVEMPEDKVTEALRFQSEPLSLSEPLRQDGDAELGDVVEDRSIDSPFDIAATTMLPEEIMRLLSPLDERERDILKLRFGLDGESPAPLRRSGSTSTSLGSGSARLKRGRCRSCAIPPATPAPAIFSTSDSYRLVAYSASYGLVELSGRAPDPRHESQQFRADL